VDDLVSGQRVWTFSELLDDARQVAAALLGVVAPGERVAVWSTNNAPWFLLEMGAGLAGVTLVTVNPAYTAAELADVLNRSRSAAIVLADQFRGRSLAPLLDEALPALPQLRTVIPLSEWDAFLAAAKPVDLPRVKPNDPAQIEFTSGTTGSPKAALLPHGGICANAAAGAERWGFMPGEPCLNAMPLFHIAGSVIFGLGAIAAGATQLLAAFQPPRTAALWQVHRPDVVGLAGTMWRMLLDHTESHGIDLTGLRLAVTGGQSIPPKLVDRVEAATGAPMSILWGMTELCGTAAAVSPDDDRKTRRETWGRALPGIELRIVDPITGNPLGPDNVGEVQVRGWGTMTCYDGNEAATAETILPDGWLRTGDLGTLDADQRLRIAGRVKEMIIRGAENIYPAEIENLLRLHPCVADVAVVGLPCEIYGESVAAALVLRDGAVMPSDNELISHCRNQIAPFKIPKKWVQLANLPLTPVGKVKKFEVRNAILAAAPTTAQPS
jgi:fatty-acyl-CoA synthase